MRRTCLTCIHELAKEDDRIFFIPSDPGPGLNLEFLEEFPDRYLMEGISEAHVTGLAAGLALEGKIPFVYILATFVTRRNYDQIAIDLCEQNLPVRLVAQGAGLVYAGLGPTHMSIDDLSLLRTLPNMTIVAPADAEEMRRIMFATKDHNGPIYIRLARGWEPVVTDERPFEIGRGYRYKDGTDALVVTTGTTLSLGLEAADELKKSDINISVLHIPTIKPLCIDTLVDSIKKVPTVVTIEEHFITGGLGTAVAEVIAEAELPARPKLRRLGVSDQFPTSYGTRETMANRFGITTENLVRTVLSSTARQALVRT